MSFDWDVMVSQLKTGAPSLYVWLEKSSASYDEKENKCVIDVPSGLHKKNLNEKYSEAILNILKQPLMIPFLFPLKLAKHRPRRRM